jgi:hypothetical protein
VGIGAHHIGQRVRIRGVVFGPGDAVPFPVTRSFLIMVS